MFYKYRKIYHALVIILAMLFVSDKNKLGVITQEGTAEQMSLALKCYRKIREKYPDIVFDEEFDTFASEETSAEDWIETFVP